MASDNDDENLLFQSQNLLGCVQSLRGIRKKDALKNLNILVTMIRRGKSLKKNAKYLSRLEVDFAKLELDYKKKGLCLSGKIDNKYD